MANSGVALKLAGKSSTSPTANKQGTVCYLKVFKLTDLPDIMDSMGWKVASIIMRKWLKNPAHTMSREEKTGKTDSRLYPYSLVDTSTVKMSWALSFPRVKAEYDAIFEKKGFFKPPPAEYEKPAALRQLIRRIAAAGKFGTNPEYFGNMQLPVTDLNELWQFQVHKIGAPAFQTATYGKAAVKDAFLGDPDLDDMFGALAACLLKIAGEGTVTPKTKTFDTGAVQVEHYDISVEKIGVYIRDTYDFNGDQYLGYWRKDTAPHIRLYAPLGPSRGSCPEDFVEVTNERFRAHRALTGKGGDLLIFSDVLVTTLKKPYKFRVSPQEIQSAIAGISK